LGSVANGPGITWYDVLGILPGASVDQVQRQHESKVSLLRPQLLSGAPSPVVSAATRARQILDAASRVLTDPANRARYDETVGIRRTGGGLSRRAEYPTLPGTESFDNGLLFGNAGAEMLGAMLALSDWLTPHPSPPKHVAVPDVTGLFYSVCLGIAGKLGLRITTVRLTQRPMPVDGLVVAQSPVPAAKARRDSAITVQVWHPSDRSAAR